MAGEYELRIKVTDPDGNIAVDYVLITATSSSGDTQDQAAALVDEGITALEESFDFETAYSKFSQAVATDPTYPEAVLGYSMLDMMMVAIDPAMVDLATNYLGLADYPSDFASLIDLTWLETVTIEEDWDDDGTIDNTYDFMAPRITNQSNYDIDSDGTIDGTERGIAAAAFFAANNDGFNYFVDEISWMIEDRLDAAFSNLDAVPSDAQMTVSWEMFGFPTESDAINSGWPTDSAGTTAIDIVLGKAELKLIAASLHMLRHQFYLAQVWNLTLPLQAYWDAFGEDLIDGDTDNDDNPMELGYLTDGDTLNTPANPLFGNFLEARADASNYITYAKWDFEDFLNEIQEASNMMLSRGSPYTLSSAEWMFDGTDGPAWSEIETGIYFIQQYIGEIQDSLYDNTLAILPNTSDAFDYNGPVEYWDHYLSNWPTDVGPEYYSMGVNFYNLYNSGAIGISALFDLHDGTNNTAGEPVFYSYSSGSFVEETTVPALDGSDPIYYVKMIDPTLGGAIDLDSIPADDPTDNGYYFYFDWDDWDY
jgi:hypothetical protein